ncbi:hypothetical protein NDU88_007625 [Pleurodeles waltl]|uniref:Uncharacterized protein n=1 Tax=Pleurodeles waltl TaxID=8319 RepID=A0AAV7NBY5_PLEWA|nr:hypothetical protein NDU88_007625 [Pleurodeles waltl]
MACSPLKWRPAVLYGGTGGSEVIPLTLCAFAGGCRQQPGNSSLVIVGHYGVQWPMVIYASGDGQHPSKEGYMACHHQGGADPGGLRQVEHPLSETMGGPETLGTEDGEGPAGDGLPTRNGCPSNPTPLMVCILAVAYPELDGHLGASQQPQGGEYSAIITTYAWWGGIRVGDVCLWVTLGQA